MKGTIQRDNLQPNSSSLHSPSFTPYGIDRNIYGESASLAWHTVYINRAFKQLYQHTDNGKSKSKPSLP